ncbi:MAG: response regulator, partial [Treponema sp.]|nr:response regulator [Treponema sp.]
LKRSEVQTFKRMANEANSFRLCIFAPALTLYMLTELVSDTRKLLSPEKAQCIFRGFGLELNAYAIFVLLDALIVFSSALMFIVNLIYRARTKRNENLFLYLVRGYGNLLLTVSFLAVALTAYMFGPVDFTFFYLIALITSAVFYLDCVITIPVTLGYFIALNVMARFCGWNISYDPYMPYGIFFILTVCLISLFRAYYLLVTLRREAEIKRLKEEADRQNRLKSTFLANMSHEIRTPMNAIIGMSELAMDFSLAPSEKNTIRQINTAGVSLLGIINDILDFSKIESGKMEIVPADYDLLSMILDVVNVSRVRLQGKDVDMRFELDPTLPALVHGDDNRIRQVLVNLAGNAAKFTESGFVTIRVERKADRDGGGECDAIRFSVADSGIGIRKEDLERIFAAFQQVDMRMNRSKGGTGLGLSISRNLVHLMGGVLEVDSEPGKGSTFSFCIRQPAVSSQTVAEKYPPLFVLMKPLGSQCPGPLVASSVAVLDRPEISALFAGTKKKRSFKAPKARILVVDDNELNLQVAEGLLGKLGVAPELASGGVESLALLDGGRKYDIIFMDHQMPVMDGVEALKKIRRREAEGSCFRADGAEGRATVIALSANAANGAEQMFLDAGFDGFVSKPVQEKDFARALRQWLNSSLLEEVSEDASCNGNVPGQGNPASDEGAHVDSSIIRTFVRMIDPSAQEIQDYLQSGDIKNYTIKVHALKSSARIVGATELSVLAQELEALGNSADREAALPQIREKTPALLELYRSYKEKFASFMEDDLRGGAGADGGGAQSPGGKKELSEEAFSAIADAIRDACLHSDLNALDEQLARFRDYRLSEGLAALVRELEEAAEMVDFDAVLGHLNHGSLSIMEP